MHADRRVVDNRTFLLGLTELYRAEMKSYERTELRRCARRAAAALQLAPAEVPVEGYYRENRWLTEYFRLVRALQDVPESKAPLVASMPEYQRLLEVISSPLFGRSEPSEKLLPTSYDALSRALDETVPLWTVPGLTAAAAEAAEAMDDYSLVGIAALSRDPVQLASARESVVLYVRVRYGAAAIMVPPQYDWMVDDELDRQATRFVNTFNALFGDELPLPGPDNAQFYWTAAESEDLSGRCVRLGVDPVTSLHYHWAICGRQSGGLVVQEFWKPEIWTTDRYREFAGPYRECPDF